MPLDGEHTRWMWERAGVASLQRVSAIVKDIQGPCLHHSPAKGSKMLKPEKWQAVFLWCWECFGFPKSTQDDCVGGVDPSIRAEVWEFLLGCYSLSSSKENRMQLWMARRERYEDLIRQCQMMHSSIGTGSLAYVVSSKVMDARTSSKTNITEGGTESPRGSCDTSNNLERLSDMNSSCRNTSCTQQIRCSSNLVGVGWLCDIHSDTSGGSTKQWR